MAIPWGPFFGFVVELAQSRVHSHCDGTTYAHGIGCVTYMSDFCHSHLRLVDGG